MTFRVKIARRAERQIRDATVWWAENRTQAPDLLAEDLDGALDLIEEFPYAGEAVRHRRGALRRVLLSRVSYHLYYSIDPESRIVNVLALWHTRRGAKPRL